MKDINSLGIFQSETGLQYELLEVITACGTKTRVLCCGGKMTKI